MINRLTHVTVLVENLDEALQWYTAVLGLKKKTDLILGNGYRWVTVGPEHQQDVKIILQEPDPQFHGEVGAQLLLNKVGQGPAWVFETDDCRKTYETLKSRNVTFLSPVEETEWGYQTVFLDLYGNQFVLVEPLPSQKASDSP
ncbi:MAG: VOC family protein [Theionarchaea archaeon]|nr:VOC family protein [Theionarchaea archaeon]